MELTAGRIAFDVSYEPCIDQERIGGSGYRHDGFETRSNASELFGKALLELRFALGPKYRATVSPLPLPTASSNIHTLAYLRRFAEGNSVFGFTFANLLKVVVFWALPSPVYRR